VGITEQLARFATETSDFLNPQLIESSKYKILDTLGIMIAGAHSPTGKAALDAVRQSGDSPEATVIGWPDRTSISNAGFVNGVSAHALEYDDLTVVVGHASVCLVPACLAVAESMEMSGRQMLEGFVLGFEVASRIGKGMQPFILERGWHPTGIIGAQGVAAASCRMMGLDQMATRMAMGITASSTSGVRKNIGSMGKAFHVGNGVRSGIFAAILARSGFKVDPDIIDSSGDSGNQRYGLADCFNGVGNYRLDGLCNDLGTHYELAQNTTMVRLHPGSTPPGAAIDGIIELAESNNLRPENIEELRIACHPKMLAIGSYSEPVDEYKARFCLPYIFAVAFIDRQLGLEQYAPEKLGDTRIREFMKRVKIVAAPDTKLQETGDHGNTLSWARVRIAAVLKSGNTIESEASYGKGWPQRPATWDDLCRKYEDCTQRVLTPSQIAESIAIVKEVDQLDNLRELINTVTPRGA